MGGLVDGVRPAQLDLGCDPPAVGMLDYEIDLQVVAVAVVRERAAVGSGIDLQVADRRRLAGPFTGGMWRARLADCPGYGELTAKSRSSTAF